MQESVDAFSSINLIEHKAAPSKGLLSPKGKSAFRVCHLLDPLDVTLFTGVMYEASEAISTRMDSIGQNVSFSYRLSPKEDGQWFSGEFNYKSWLNHLLGIAQSDVKNSFVVKTDIADFYPRIYLHRIENALSNIDISRNHKQVIEQFIKAFNARDSFGIPVGSNASRLIAELILCDIDDAIMSEGINHTRFVDDIVFMAKDYSDAYRKLSAIAEVIYNCTGHTLSEKKTEIIEKNFFIDKLQKDENDPLMRSANKAFESVIGVSSGRIEEADAEKILSQIKMSDLEKGLADELSKEIPSDARMRRLLQIFKYVRSKEGLEIIKPNLSKLYPYVPMVVEIFLKVAKDNLESAVELGNDLIRFSGETAVSDLPLVKSWMLEPFCKIANINHLQELRNWMQTENHPVVKRQLILALGKARDQTYLRSNKKSLEEMSSIEKRAFLYAAKSLPEDEYKFWTRSIMGRATTVERIIMSWKPIS
jgi:hypothetical protein